MRRELVGTCESDLQFKFESPWLALNQKNFKSYTGTTSQKARKEELARILVGNCLGINKALDLPLRNRISANCDKLTSIKNAKTGENMIGFVGKFSINFRLPDYLGIGKGVARGMGTVCEIRG